MSRVIGELMIIVVGVVIALQFEGVRDHREDLARESAALRGLLADLTETQRRLTRDIRRQQETLDAQQRLLQLADGDRPLPPNDSLGVLVSRSIRFQRLEPVRGTYDALLGAGELRLIRSDALRASVASLFGLIGDGFEDEDLSTALRADMLLSVSETAPLIAISGAEFRGVVGLPPRDEEASYVELLNNDRYISGLMAVSAAETFQMNYFRNIERRLEETIAFVRTQSTGRYAEQDAG